MANVRESTLIVFFLLLDTGDTALYGRHDCEPGVRELPIKKKNFEDK